MSLLRSTGLGTFGECKREMGKSIRYVPHGTCPKPSGNMVTKPTYAIHVIFFTEANSEKEATDKLLPHLHFQGFAADVGNCYLAEPARCEKHGTPLMSADDECMLCMGYETTDLP